MGLGGSGKVLAYLGESWWVFTAFARFLRVLASQWVSVGLRGYRRVLTGFRGFQHPNGSQQISAGLAMSMQFLLGLGKARHLSGSTAGLDSLSGSRRVSWGLERI